MSAAIDAMRGTIERLQRFAGGGGVRLTRVDVPAVIKSAVELIAPALGVDGRPAIDVELALAERLPPVVGHAADLQNVFINLLLNARDAMPDGGTVTIAARRSRDHVVVSVCDQGGGVAPEHLPRLFDPFFTTKAAAGGAGLGLSLAYGLVRAADGDIRAANRAGGGLEITLELPVARKSAQRPPRRRS